MKMICKEADVLDCKCFKRLVSILSPLNEISERKLLSKSRFPFELLKRDK